MVIGSGGARRIRNVLRSALCGFAAECAEQLADAVRR